MSADFDNYARAEQVTDTFLHSLQQNNELVIAYAVETYAWAKTVNYQILAKNGNEWKGYSYYINKSNQGASKPPTEIVVSADECNKLWKFMQQKEAWKIPGDKGENFCPDGNKNCNINDGANWRLLIITKDKVTDPSYYEPAFFEKCCPGNEQRKLFVETVDKIKHAVHESDDEEE